MNYFVPPTVITYTKSRQERGEDMITLLNNRKLVIMIIVLLCAGCFHETSSTPSPGGKKSLQDKQATEFAVVPGETIQIHDKNGSQRTATSAPAKGIVFVDELHGYGWGSPENGTSPFMRTSDGGMNWLHERGVPDAKSTASISFLDARIGWMLTSEFAGMQSELRLTADGGRTWEVIAKNLPGLEGSTNTAFFRFFDRQKGLIAVQSDKGVVLLRTQDGGITWLASNRIALPGEGLMTFLSPNEGWLISKRKELATLYHMRDGETWEEAGGISTALAPQAISFADAEHGFMILQSNLVSPEKPWERLLLRTVDGGITWSQHAFPAAFLPADAGVQLNFLTSSIGWLWDAKHVWRSKDGGLSWQMLEP
ncbi:WD40/YVTN/BNR-like repeat-containing protein [Paenibacillus sp. GCM10023248]|uniref:WD40/YVTN/BNR-like repeat-containing protein n=1 Tax=unclassified Paenibacillus TaxID=185978 RepID=UPI002378A05E|nr:hypothetical protein [Paenibacillus sp. MAHUQ-63]MDD9270208.1 hypothetical protein [Paenibacillus sp. MAHUQ-63]